jgi:hypothetical protein
MWFDGALAIRWARKPDERKDHLYFGTPEIRRRRHLHLCRGYNGSGISDEILPHIFEPFFTTTKIAGSRHRHRPVQVYSAVLHIRAPSALDSTVEWARVQVFSSRFTRNKRPESPAEPAAQKSAGRRRKEKIFLLVKDDAESAKRRAG